MKKTTFHRLVALVLAFCFLFGGALSVSAADSGGSSTTDRTTAEIKEQLNAISYAEYCESVLEGVPNATEEIPILGVDYDPEKTDAKVYETTVGGALALHTPATGVVSWKVVIPTTAVYSIIIEYWPDEAKAASIERILKINDKIPFAEARFITLPKVWKNDYTKAEVSDPNGKVSVQSLYEQAVAAGFDVEDLRIRNSTDGAYLEISIPETWTEEMCAFVEKYTVRFFVSDVDNNELRPSMVQDPEWRTYELRDADGFYAESFSFAFEAGEQTISLEAVNEPMTIKSIKLVPHTNMISYKDYLATIENKDSGKDWLHLEAEYANASSSQTIYPIEDRTDAATSPSDTDRTVLNTIGGEKWQTAGQWVRYKFSVNTSGMYNIGARYRQNVLDGMYVCRALRITSNGAEVGTPGYYDGSIPFAEASRLQFNYGNEWQSTLFNSGEYDEEGNLIAYQFYFEKDVEYTVEMEVTLGSMGDVVSEVESILNSINADYLAIMKLTGADPDEYRDYGFARVMPDVMIDMILQSRALYWLNPETGEYEGVAAELAKIAGEKSSSVATLEQVAWLLERMGSDEDQIAKYLDQLKSYIGSLGTWLGDAKTQPLQLDYLVVQPVGNEEPQATAGFWASLVHEVKSFIMSFFRNYDRMGATAEENDDSEAIEVWLAYGRDQAQVIRNLVNNDFTPEYGVPVNLKLVAGGTLLPSVLAGMGPDVYIGVGQGDVINYAIRDAILPIENMEGFRDLLYYEVDENFHTVLDADGNPIKNKDAQFNEAAMLVLGIDDAEGKFHYYGLPETQSFNMMFVRTDILADLDIEIPKTWDDILAAIPILQANNMQIGMHTDYKVFLYQMGGELFADNGMRINLDSNVGLEAFETMCNFFTMYSFPYEYDFANRFRTGEMPIGFVGYTGTYNHLTVFATEIKGLWEFLPMPGLVDEDGNINNVSVSSVSAIVMMNDKELKSNEKKMQNAWSFMVWHAGADCQTKYSNEMVAIIGPSAKHSTANLQALEGMPWTHNELTQLQAQFNKLASIPNYPGSYIIDRYTSFAFLAALNENADPVTELQSYITTINKEITRKRAEFGLETLELGQTLAEKRMDQALAAYEKDTKGMNDSTKDAAKIAYEMMMDGMEEESWTALEDAAREFAEVDAEAFKATIAALGNAVAVMKK